MFASHTCVSIISGGFRSQISGVSVLRPSKMSTLATELICSKQVRERGVVTYAHKAWKSVICASPLAPGAKGDMFLGHVPLNQYGLRSYGIIPKTIQGRRMYNQGGQSPTI